jgi:hypothetical protein
VCIPELCPEALTRKNQRREKQQKLTKDKNYKLKSN